MFVRIAASALVCLSAVLSGVPGPAVAGSGDGVGVFHDRVVKRDPAGDVSGDGTTPIDIRRITYDHHKLGDSEHLTVTVRLAHRVRRASDLRWGSSTGAGGYAVEFRWIVGESFRLERDNNVVRRPHVRLTTDGREAIVRIPWRKLGSPRSLVGLHFLATYPYGVDRASKLRAVLH
jgi:hypothetical protein